MSIELTMRVIDDSFREIQKHFRPREAQSYLLGIMGLKGLSEMDNDNIIRWHTFVENPYRVGERLNDALRRIEDVCPEYRDLLYRLDYTSQSGVGQQQNDKLWSSVIDRISRIFLRDLVRDDPAALSRLCIYLNDQASLAERKGGSFDPSESVVDLIMALLQPGVGRSFYDPFCASGVTLLGAAAAVSSDTQDHRMGLFAQTVSEESARLIGLNLFCANVHNARVAVGDMVPNPGFVEGRRLQTFDRIACFIPVGVRVWGETKAHHDPYGRFVYGIPPRSQGDFAYLQHCIASLSDAGVLVAGVTPSILFKERTEGEIRRRIVEDDLIEAVISLPQKIIPQTSIPFYLLVIRRNKPEERRGKILFVDASKDYLPGRSRNTLRKEDIDVIKKVYYTFEEINGFSAVCSIKTIAEHDFILEVADYVTQPQVLEIDHTSFDRETALAELKDLQEERCRRYNRMITTLTDLMEHGGMD